MKTSSIITALLSLSIASHPALPIRARRALLRYVYLARHGDALLVQMMSWQFAAVTNQLAQHSEYLRDLTKFCALPKQRGALDYPVSAESAGFGTIEFQNVSFRYPGTEKYILQNLNLTLEPERHYAIVGINGAGKTTPTKLLTGLYDNFEGRNPDRRPQHPRFHAGAAQGDVWCGLPGFRKILCQSRGQHCSRQRALL